jgi:hypothetical protein
MLNDIYICQFMEIVYKKNFKNNENLLPVLLEILDSFQE